MTDEDGVINGSVFLGGNGGWWYTVRKRNGEWLMWDAKRTTFAWVGDGEKLMGWRPATTQESEEIELAMHESTAG